MPTKNEITPSRINECTKWLLSLPLNMSTDFNAENRELIEICIANIHQSKKGMFVIFDKLNVVKKKY